MRATQLGSHNVFCQAKSERKLRDFAGFHLDGPHSRAMTAFFAASRDYAPDRLSSGKQIG
jgi:hypothetical protein